MRILVACRAFDNMAGGVERMAIVLMGAMCERGHEVHLLTWDRADARAFYPMDSRIVWHRLALGDQLQKAGWGMRLSRALKVRRLVRHVAPDVMIAFQHGTFLALRLFTAGMGVPVIAAERNAPHRFDFLKSGRNEAMIYPTFLLADRVTIQCDSYRERYPAFLHSRMVTIPNPVFPASVQADPAGHDAQVKTLLCVGRLNYQKNQAVLIRAFSALAHDFPGWRLVLAGEGEDRAALERRVAATGASGRIEMNGAVSDVSSLYRSAHMFCLPSLWEGFPNALAEAMVHGLPVAGFAGCAGVRDLVRDGETGLLASGNNDAAALERVLRTALGDADLRVKLGRAGRESMKSYVPDEIYDAWEDLFQEVAAR